MTRSVPAPPEFGSPLPIRESQAVLDFLALRRSASAATLQAPGPSAEELETLLRLAARAPDHGKLSPWRFVILEGAAKQDFIAGLERVAAGRPDAAKASGKLFKIKIPPLTIAVVSRAAEGGEIPMWEQELSAGAVCTLLTLAAAAMGYGANWITDWYAYDADAMRLLGLKAGERVAGFVHIGTAAEPPQERVRPDMATVVSRWERERG